MGGLETNITKEKYADLSKNKRATIRKFKNMVLLDIREFYTDASGEAKPGKKGISLTREQWELLLDSKDEIEEAMEELDQGRTAKKAKTEPKKEEVKKENNTKEILVKKEAKPEE